MKYNERMTHLSFSTHRVSLQWIYKREIFYLTIFKTDIVNQLGDTKRKYFFQREPIGNRGFLMIPFSWHE
jgi:hypothetical protein